MRFDINKLHIAIEEWSKDIPAEDIHIVIPRNDSKKRDHLGLSSLADDCQRKVFYQFRKVAKPVFPPHVLRLFQRGHREEFFFTHMLTCLGLTIHEVNPKTGKQFKVSDFEGHLAGSMDGVAVDKEMRFTSSTEPFKLEYKTYNLARFKTLVKAGVKESDPKYYGQVQGYLGYTKWLTGSLFCAVCKDNDSFHFEWIVPDTTSLEMIRERAELILNATTPPPGISKRKSHWKCKMCDYADNCFTDIKGYRKPSVKSCRSCAHATPGLNKTWDCNVGGVYGNLCEKWEDVNR
jgi:hypothetical protein